MRSNTGIDFTGALLPLFVGSELSLSGDLTIFGRDLPEFRVWACENGIGNVDHVTDPSQYFAGHHRLVAHDFGQRVTLDRMREVKSRIRSLIGCAQRLVLFIDIEEHCTIESVRQSLRSALPDLTFRIVYPRAVYRTTGTKVILVERRLPRIFLFMTDLAMAGKTETALLFSAAPNVRLVHGDEWFYGIRNGDIETVGNLRQRIDVLHDDKPFDRSLFAEFLAHIPALNEQQDQDIVFDFLIPRHKQLAVMEYFGEHGFFPILCQTLEDRRQLLVKTSEIEHRLGVYMEEARFLRGKLEKARRRSITRKISDPVRTLGRQARMLAKAGFQRFNSLADAFTGR